VIYIVLALILAYLLGSIPTAYIFGRVLKNIDIREHGSGNVGATNVFRTVGKVPGIIALAIDALKGVIAVTLLPFILERILGRPLDSFNFNILILLGAAAIAGHVWTVFLRFKGGKGVATTAGVMAGLSPWVFIVCLMVWVIIFAIWRFVSLASIFAATSLPIFAVILGKDLYFVVFCSVLCIIGVYNHRSNIKRLLNGTEKKIQ